MNVTVGCVVQWIGYLHQYHKVMSSIPADALSSWTWHFTLWLKLVGPVILRDKFVILGVTLNLPDMYVKGTRTLCTVSSRLHVNLTWRLFFDTHEWKTVAVCGNERSHGDSQGERRPMLMVVATIANTEERNKRKKSCTWWMRIKVYF